VEVRWELDLRPGPTERRIRTDSGDRVSKSLGEGSLP